VGVDPREAIDRQLDLLRVRTPVATSVLPVNNMAVLPIIFLVVLREFALPQRRVDTAGAAAVAPQALDVEIATVRRDGECCTAEHWNYAEQP
jgi:hypothetical protein